MNDKKNKSERDDREQEIRMDTLQRLRLHFVFNVLNTIRYHIYQNPEKAYEMVYDLSIFIRGSIDFAGQMGPVGLGEELRYIDAYMRLECSMGDYLTYENRCEGWDVLVEPGSICSVLRELIRKKITTRKVPYVIRLDTAPSDRGG